jgi:hypothetical protein
MEALLSPVHLLLVLLLEGLSTPYQQENFQALQLEVWRVFRKKRRLPS